MVACFIAAGSFFHFNLAQYNQNSDISLADISVMAQADGENDPCPGGESPGCKYHDDFPDGCEFTMYCYVTCPISACN